MIVCPDHETAVSTLNPLPPDINTKVRTRGLIHFLPDSLAVLILPNSRFDFHLNRKVILPKKISGDEKRVILNSNMIKNFNQHKLGQIAKKWDWLEEYKALRITKEINLSRISRFSSKVFSERASTYVFKINKEDESFNFGKEDLKYSKFHKYKNFSGKKSFADKFNINQSINLKKSVTQLSIESISDFQMNKNSKNKNDELKNVNQNKFKQKPKMISDLKKNGRERKRKLISELSRLILSKNKRVQRNRKILLIVAGSVSILAMYHYLLMLKYRLKSFRKILLYFFFSVYFGFKNSHK